MTPGDVVCLYEDEELFVLNKPTGMLIHRGWGVAEVALVDFARRRTPGGAAYPVQRLDRGASGAVIFAKSAQAARLLAESAQLPEHRKIYLALVRGELAQDVEVDHAISRQEGGPPVPARTLVRSLAVAPTEPRHVSLVWAMPVTGRLHQVRRHLKHINHPLIGDVKYGHGDLNRAFRDRYLFKRLGLHAAFWTAQNPISKQVVSGWVPLPDDFAEPLRNMGFELANEELQQQALTWMKPSQ